MNSSSLAGSPLKMGTRRRYSRWDAALAMPCLLAQPAGLRLMFDSAWISPPATESRCDGWVWSEGSVVRERTGSKRMAAFAGSGIRRVFDAAAALEREGHAIAHLEIGRPDFDTPAHIKTGAIDALQRGHVH